MNQWVTFIFFLTILCGTCSIAWLSWDINLGGGEENRKLNATPTNRSALGRVYDDAHVNEEGLKQENNNDNKNNNNNNNNIWETCLNYTTRYATCQWLRNKYIMNSSSLASIFMFWGRRSNATEVVVLRMNNKGPWSSDYWLSVCSLVMESSSSTRKQRDVVLHVTVEAWPWLPLEFHKLAYSHDEQIIKHDYPFFKSTYIQGEFVMAHLWLHIMKKSQYTFMWASEEDCRLVGHWDHQVFLKHYENSSDQADLIVWHGKGYNASNFNRQTWWHQPQFYHGRWANTLPPMVGVWTMTFGMSRLLAETLLRNLAEGTFNDCLEINLPTTVYDANLSVIYNNEVRREWECCTSGNAQSIYNEWMSNASSCIQAPFLMHAVKIP
jgi:hypothetical protein